MKSGKFATKNVVYGSSLAAMAMLAALFAGCASKPMPAHTPAPAPVTTAPAPPPVAAAPSASRLPPVASMAEYRRRAAQMIVAANPGGTYTGPVPNPSPGIAVVTVMLNADGSVRNVDLMRGSSLSPQVNGLAIAAARRVGNYGPVSNLPGPWQFNETFVFNSADKFQLDTIISGR